MANDITALAMSKEQITALREHCDRIARSGLVPDHFAKNPAAIYTAISMARALGEVPETLMQEIYFISGKAGLTAKYMLSRMQRTKAIKGTVRYVIEGKGPTLSVRAVATDAETGDSIEGPAATMEMAVAETWVKNPKYKSMPEVMLRNRALTFLARYHYPNSLMGFLTVNEVEDIAYAKGTIRAYQPGHASIEGGGAIAALNAEIVPHDVELEQSNDPTPADLARLEAIDRGEA